jgi:hypothetical protein
MKHFAAVLCAVLFATPAWSLNMRDSQGRTPPTAPAARFHSGMPDFRYEQFESQIVALREEGLKLRAADGGTLSQAHHAYLQEKYDALLAEMKRADGNR